jgi:hypothetical protein
MMHYQIWIIGLYKLKVINVDTKQLIPPKINNNFISAELLVFVVCWPIYGFLYRLCFE